MYALISNPRQLLITAPVLQKDSIEQKLKNQPTILAMRIH